MTGAGRSWGISKSISPVMECCFGGRKTYTVTVELGSLTTVPVSGPWAERERVMEAARLIAAAPDLLAACDGVRAFLDGEDDAPDGSVSVDGLADYEPVTVTINAGVVRAIRASVAKAKWRS